MRDGVLTFHDVDLRAGQLSVVRATLIFSLQFERTVNRDNTVSFQNLTLQIERVNWRGTLAGCTVMVHQHLDGTLSITHGPHRLGRYTAQGEALTSTQNAAPRAVEKTLRGKVQKRTFNLLTTPDAQIACLAGPNYPFRTFPWVRGGDSSRRHLLRRRPDRRSAFPLCLSRVDPRAPAALGASSH